MEHILVAAIFVINIRNDAYFQYNMQVFNREKQTKGHNAITVKAIGQFRARFYLNCSLEPNELWPRAKKMSHFDPFARNAL